MSEANNSAPRAMSVETQENPLIRDYAYEKAQSEFVRLLAMIMRKLDIEEIEIKANDWMNYSRDWLVRTHNPANGSITITMTTFERDDDDNL